MKIPRTAAKQNKTENLFLVVKYTVNSMARVMKCYENVHCSDDLILTIMYASVTVSLQKAVDKE